MRTQARTTRPCRAAAGHSAAMPPPFIRRAAAPFICGGAAPFIRRAAALVILATLTVSAHAETVSIGGILISVAGACLVVWLMRKLIGKK